MAVRLFDQQEKVARTKKEVTRLRRLFKQMAKDRQAAAEGLIQEAAFMRVTLEETRHVIDSEGVIEEFKQGAQRFLREHPATKVYASLINRYTAVCKQLIDLLPSSDAGQAADELIAFVKAKKR